MTHVFTYGSLMFPEVWHKVVRGRHAQSHAAVRGYKRRRITVDDYPVAFRGLHSDWLEGRLYYSVNAADLNRLDAFEGAYYKRDKVQARVWDDNGDEHIVTAELYCIKARYRPLISNQPWNPETFRRRQLKPFIRRYR